MSQYPSPYMPPNIAPQYGGPLDALKPARRASTLMFVVGVLMILFSGCMIGITFMFPLLPAAQLQPLRDQVQAVSSFSVEMLFRVIGIMVFVVAALLVTIAFFVRRGGLVSAIVGCVLVGLIELQQVLSLIGSIMAARDITGLGSLCASGIVFAAFTLLFVWLIAAARAAPKVKFAQQQYLSQYWQYQQNMQAYAGYPTQPTAQGYATPNDRNVPPNPPPAQV